MAAAELSIGSSSARRDCARRASPRTDVSGALRVGDNPSAIDLESLLGAIADGRVAGTFTPAGSSTHATTREVQLSLMFADERVYRATLGAVASCEVPLRLARRSDI